MSQSSIIETQVAEMKEAGFPVMTGTRAFRSESGEADVKAVDSWLHRWARHAAQNYARISKGRGVRFLSGSCEGMPAITIGIGPSLDLHYEALARLRNRAILIATDAAYRPLIANGVIPDLVMSYDCKRDQSSLWEGMVTRGVPMIFDSCAHPEVINSWVGPKLYYNHWHTKDEFSDKLLPYIYPDFGEIPSAGTVGNMALQLANILGCRKIATVGMDLCYAKIGDGWKYRCRDWVYANGRKEEKADSFLYKNDERVARSFMKPMGTVLDPDVKASDDEKALSYRTDPELAIYAKSFLELAQYLKMDITHCATWNIFGTAIPGGSLEEFVAQHCRIVYQSGRTMVWNLDRIDNCIKFDGPLGGLCA